MSTWLLIHGPVCLQHKILVTPPWEPWTPTQNVAEVTPEASAQASWNILEALNTLTMEETQVPCGHVLERLRAAESSLPAIPELAPDT